MGIGDTVDPLGGSYYVETLTNQMEAAIKQEMLDVEKRGGIVPAIASGDIQKAISLQAYQRELAIQEGRIPKVGLNCHKDNEEAAKPVAFHPYSDANAATQINALKRVRETRNNADVARCLKRVESDAISGINLMPAVIEAVKAYATVGEITKTLKMVYGEYQEPNYF